MPQHAFTIYDASAGSGKTYTLVKEYLKIILTAIKNDAYRNILAITFTNKAVHEMKSRIVDSLSEFRKDNPSKKAAQLMQVLSEETQLSVADIKIKSQHIIKHIIHNYAAFDISTIDKFTHKVIRTFAHDLNLPISFEVSLDTEILLTEAVDAIIAQAGEDDLLTKLLVDFTMEKTDDDKSWDISREILETGKLILNENNREEIVHFKDKSIAEFNAIKKQLTEACKNLDAECVDSARQAIALLSDKQIDDASFSARNFPNHLNYILNNKLKSTHKKYHLPEDVRINKTAKDREAIEGLLPQLLTVLACVYKNQEKKNFYTAFLKNITPLSLLNTVSLQLAKIQEEQNILSIAEFNAIIHREIQNQPAPFIYERLGERYKHFFIDEFQDTSEMQFQNLIPLIDNAIVSEDLQGEKGSLMIVGDPKQSIYRWRGGKAEQFISLGKDWNPFANKDRQLEHLATNYRSYAQVIDFNNKFFHFLSGEFENADYKDLYQNHSHQLATEKSGGYVNISFVPKSGKSDPEGPDQDELYLEAVLKTIREVQTHGFQFKDIAVLVRHNKDGVAVANHLTSENIPLQSSETLLIANATEIKFVIQLLYYLKSNKDLEAKAGFLQYLAAHQQDRLPIHDFIAEGMAKKEESEFEKWLSEFDIKLSFEAVRKKALYETVEIIISKCISQKNNAYIQFFLDIVLERDAKYQAGIADFLEYWEKKASKFSIPSPEGHDAVRIISIHKSKGLEFPVVIFPFADEDYSRQRKEKLWVDFESEGFGLPKVLIDNNSTVEGFSETASETYQQKKQEELLDNINILYVALTRAEEQLYIISRFTEPNKQGDYPKCTASFFIRYLTENHSYHPEQFIYEFGSREKQSAATQETRLPEKIMYVENVLESKNIKIAQKESLMWGTVQQEAIAYGNVIHEILSYVTDKSQVENAIEKALEEGLISKMQEAVVTQAIYEIVAHPELGGYFSTANKVLNEQAIIQKEGPVVKPDRMVITTSDEVLLLDYKTGVHQQKYQQQLSNYQQAIENMGFKVTKKTLVYIGETINVVNLPT